MVLICDRFNQFRSNDSLHNEIIILHLTHRNTILYYIIQEQQTGLVTIDQHPFSFVIFTSHTYTVSIRITSHYNVGVNFLSQINSHRQSLGIFRIRRNNSRKIATLHHLFRHGMYIFKSPLLQCTRNQHHTCTVDRSIDNLHVFVTGDSCRINRNSFHHIQINLIDVFTDNLNQILVAIELDVGHSHLVHLINDTFIVRSQYLCTIIPISLVTIVFSRIMRGSNIDTALATEMTDSK